MHLGPVAVSYTHLDVYKRQKVPFTGDFYVGIGVCAHDKDDVQKAVFQKVSIWPLAASSGKPVLLSSLETVTIASTDRHVEYVDTAHFEAPNWSPDGKSLIFNQDGTLPVSYTHLDVYKRQLPRSHPSPRSRILPHPPLSKFHRAVRPPREPRPRQYFKGPHPLRSRWGDVYKRQHEPRVPHPFHSLIVEWVGDPELEGVP